MDRRPRASTEPRSGAGTGWPLAAVHGIGAGILLVWIVMFWALPAVMSHLVSAPEVVPVPFEFAIGGFDLTWFTYAEVAGIALAIFYSIAFVGNIRRSSSR